MSMKKKFDCMEMKRKAQERIYEETKDMTLEEELAYWERHNQRLREMQKEALAKRKTA